MACNKLACPPNTEEPSVNEASVKKTSVKEPTLKEPSTVSSRYEAKVVAESTSSHDTKACEKQPAKEATAAIQQVFMILCYH